MKVPVNTSSVNHFAVDAFLDLPVGTGGCLNAYAAFQNFDYGENYVARWAGTGSNIYAQAGLPDPRQQSDAVCCFPNRQLRRTGRQHLRTGYRSELLH